MGWTGPWVLLELIGGVALLVAVRAASRRRVDRPDVQPRAVPDPGLHRRATSPACCRRSGAAACSSCSSSGCRASGCRCTATASSSTPLWAGIYMLPLTVGFLIAGPVVGLAVRPLRRPAVRHRRHAARRRDASALLMMLPANFAFPVFAVLLLLNGIGIGPVRRAEHHRHHEQRPGRRSAARRRACAPRSRTPAWCCRSASSSR